MVGIRWWLAAVSLGTVSWGTSVSECQGMLEDLSSDFKDTCADLCEFYGRKYPQICGDVELIDCILQWHSEQCGLQSVPSKVTTRKPAATKKPATTKKPTTTTTTKKPTTTTTTKKPTTTTTKKLTTTTTKKPTTTTRKSTNSTTTKTATKSATTQKLTTTTTTTKKPTTTLRSTAMSTTTKSYSTIYPLECITEACQYRVKGFKASDTEFCQNECERIGSAADLCPDATLGEEYLMKCMEKYNSKVCYDSMTADQRVCDYQPLCVLRGCRNRVIGQTEIDTTACRALCSHYLLFVPGTSQCDMNGKGDDALAACVVGSGDWCYDTLNGSGPTCVPSAFWTDL